jgi:mannosyl-oligosaccharide alpha-1,2-mannosidase
VSYQYFYVFANVYAYATIGYDLLTGPFAHVGYDQQKVDVLLLQARNLADLLKPAFDTPSGIPDNIINITTGERLTTTETTGLAVAGTLVLEWTHLSDLTGDPSYGQLAQHAEQYLLRPEYTNGLSEPFPGLEGTNLHLNTGEFIDVAGGWNGGTDSFYEYLIKMYVYDPTAFCEYRDRWVAAADSTIRYLESNPSSRPDVTFVAAYNGTLIQSYSSHRKSSSNIINRSRSNVVLSCWLHRRQLPA